SKIDCTSFTYARTRAGYNNGLPFEFLIQVNHIASCSIVFNFFHTFLLMFFTAQFLAINTAFEIASLGEILEFLSKSCAIVIAFSRVVGDKYLNSGKAIIES